MSRKKVILLILILFTVVGAIFGYTTLRSKKIAEIKERVESYLERNGLKDTVDVGEYDVNLLKREAYLRDIKIKGLKQEDREIAVEIPFVKEVAIKRFEEDKEVGPVKLLLEINGIDFRIYLKVLKKWKTYSLNAVINNSYNKEKGEVSENFSLTGDRLFNISWEWKAKNVDREILRLARELDAEGASLSNPEVRLFISKILQVKPSLVRFSFYDQGFHNLLIEVIAKKTGLTAEEVKREIINDLKKAHSQLQDRALRTFTEALLEIVSQGKGGIEITITNDKNYSIQDLGSLFIGMALRGAPPERVLKGMEKFLKIEVRKI
ncbi:MAG: hypothetical protein DSY35_02470 [Desulfurobacterium sp.]|nr:MAG: hypothetical protein DSY35_02470 [Desulfurobacterium sp.]